MKRFLPFFFFVFATIGQTEAAWDAGSFFSCNAINPKPEVIIKSSYGRLVHDLSKSKAEINAIHNKNPHVTFGYKYSLNSGLYAIKNQLNLHDFVLYRL